MNCKRLRRRLLAAERPERPSAETQTHLDDCAACRAWHARVVKLERQIALIPVPASSGKDRLLALLAAGTPAAADRPTVRVPLDALSPRASVQERSHQKIAVAFALAATVAAFAVGLWAWSFRNQSPVAPLSVAEEFKESLRERRDKVRSTPGLGRDRVAALLDFEKSLTDEAELLAREADGKRLGVLVRYYDEIMNKDFFEQTNALASPVQREDALRAALDQFKKTESRFSQLAAELAARDASEEVLKPVLTIARSADVAYQQCLKQLTT